MGRVFFFTCSVIWGTSNSSGGISVSHFFPQPAFSAKCFKVISLGWVFYVHPCFIRRPPSLFWLLQLLEFVTSRILIGCVWRNHLGCYNFKNLSKHWQFIAMLSFYTSQPCIRNRQMWLVFLYDVTMAPDYKIQELSPLYFDMDDDMSYCPMTLDAAHVK